MKQGQKLSNAINFLRLLFFSAGFCFIPVLLWAQIAPECAGVVRPADYDEAKQNAYMENFYIAHFIPPFNISSHPQDGRLSVVGVQASYLNRLSCQERLAMNGTKTENNPASPVLPKLIFKTSLLNKSQWTWSLGVNIIPPIPLPQFQAWHGSIDSTLSYEPVLGLAVHLRSFLSLGLIKAEIAGPFSEKDPIKDDWFTPASFGGDLGFSMKVPISTKHSLYPFLSFGLAKGTSLFVVGDDDVVVFNDKYPLFDATSFVGLSYHTFGHALQISLSAGGAINTMMTGQFLIAYGF